MQQVRKVVRIPTGGSGLSEPIDIRGYRPAAIQISSVWAAANLTFRGSVLRPPRVTQVVPNGTVAGLAVDANAELCLSSVTISGMMAIGTTHAAVGGEPPVEVKLAAQFDFRPRERVIGRDVDRRGPRGQPQRQLDFQRRVIGRIVEPGFDLRHIERAAAGYGGEIQPGPLQVASDGSLGGARSVALSLMLDRVGR